MEAYIDLISRPEGYMDLNAVPEPAGGGVVLTDTKPYLYRISADGQDIGSQEFDELVGGTVAWNQLFTTSNVSVSQYDMALAITDNVMSWNGTPSGYAGAGYIGYVTLNSASFLERFKIGHRYLFTVTNNISKGSAFTYVVINNPYIEGRTYIYTPTSAPTYLLIRLWVQESVGTECVGTAHFNIIDLTQMFGSTIADYINSLETAHTGDGVAYFKSLFPNSYYAYDSGTLMSVQTSEHKMVGKNLISVNSIVCGGDNPRYAMLSIDTPIPKGTYTISCVNNSNCTISIGFYDARSGGNNTGSVAFSQGQTEKSVTLTGKTLRLYAYIGTTDYNNGKVGDISNIQMELGSKTSYEPYISHSYPLDSSLTLRGIPKLVDNKLYYDGDIYSSDGTVTRKYGIVDLGSLTWQTRATGSVNKVFSSTLPSNYMGKLTTPVNWVSEAQYIQPVSASYLINNADTVQTGVYSYNGTSASTNVIYCVTLASATPTGHLVYELATPTSETATPYTNPQYVAKGGTEEYIDARDVAIPVGHNTKYQGVLL